MHIQLRQSGFLLDIVRFKGCVQLFIAKNLKKNGNQNKWRRQCSC